MTLGLALFLPGCRSLKPASALPSDGLTNRFEFTQPQMGLPFRIVLYAADEPTARTAAQAAFARIAQLNAILSDYDTDSDLNRLSRTAGGHTWVPLGEELWIVLSRAQELAARTDGAFDVTVGPVVSLWRKARREKRLPRPERLAEALSTVGWKNLSLDPRRRAARLEIPDMRLDLGAIAKGYATDEAVKLLRQHGIRRALVSGGGDMTVADPPPGKRGWRIEIPALDVKGAPPAEFVSLANEGLATSGDLFQNVEIDGVRYSHIVNPHTGVGLTDHSLVTVIARDGITADSLATAVSVLGPRGGLRLIHSAPGAEARVMRRPGDALEVSASPGFKSHLIREPAAGGPAPAR